jgi:hypothetical protein
MKNGRILLQVLIPVALISSLVIPASAGGASATVPLPDGHTPEHLAADSPAGSPEIALNTPDTKVTPIVVTSAADAGNPAIKAGDWIKFEIEFESPDMPAAATDAIWIKLEFLSVVGTNASIKATTSMSDGSDIIEQSVTVHVDLAEGGGESLGLAGLFIPRNLTTGDSVNITGYDDITLEGETTGTYAGVQRTVVFANFEESVPLTGEVQASFYWDKQTGLLVESSTIMADMTFSIKAIETNMWEGTLPAAQIAWWLWLVIAAAIVAVAFTVYRLRKRSTLPSPQLPPEDS